MGELPKRFEQKVKEVEAAVDEQVSDREPPGGDSSLTRSDKKSGILPSHHHCGSCVLEVGSSDDESLPLINIPPNPVVLGVRKGALVIHLVLKMMLMRMVMMTTRQHLLLEIVRQDLDGVANGELLQLLAVPVVQHHHPPIGIFCIFVFCICKKNIFVFVFKLKM